MVRVPVTLEPAVWYVVGSIVTPTLVAAIAAYGGFASRSDPKRARRPSADHDTLIQISVVGLSTIVLVLCHANLMEPHSGQKYSLSPS